MRSRLVLVGLSAVMCAAALWGSGRTIDASAPDTSGEEGAVVETLPPDPNATTVPPSTIALDPSNGLPVAAGPLVVLPAGCVTPTPALAVFEGAIDAAVSTTARFRVTRMLSGSLQGYEIDGLVDVQYGQETRFLEIGQSYIVGVAASAATGGLVSTVREPAPLFGGDAVVGANDSDVDCVSIADPIRTLRLDGSSVDTGVLAPLRGESKGLLGALMRPVAIAFGVLLALVLVKHLLFAIARALRDMSDPAPVARTRSHGAGAFDGDIHEPAGDGPAGDVSDDAEATL
jgi:hypothetical protein